MSGIFRPILSQPLKHIYQILFTPEYFNYNFLWTKLRGRKRYTESVVKVHGLNLKVPDCLSFLYSYKEIFLDQIYAFKSESEAPKILDLGANIGLSILYFKSIYPKAEIMALEADPQIFNYLKNNIPRDIYSNVELINKAVWCENTVLNFASEGADGGQINLDEGGIEVEAIDIKEILSQNKFDFLKMDIEGAEEFVLPRCQGLLEDIKFIFIEYHSKIEQEQCLDKILNILKESGFRVYIRTVVQETFSPFMKTQVHSGFDLQLNIFGIREPNPELKQ